MPDTFIDEGVRIELTNGHVFHNTITAIYDVGVVLDSCHFVPFSAIVAVEILSWAECETGPGNQDPIHKEQ